MKIYKIIIAILIISLILWAGFKDIDNYNENKAFCQSKGGYWDSGNNLYSVRCIKDNLIFEVVKDSKGRRQLVK